MYLKVAQIAVISLLFSACSNPFSPSPKKPNGKNLGVEVVEEVSEEGGATTPVEVEASVAEPKKKKKIKKKGTDKYGLKPEPFSIESNEEDPELLGPQTTLPAPLSKKDQIEANKTTESM